MNDLAPNDTTELSRKIKRLVEERGWNQEEFARITRLNRHTVRQILLSGDRRLRNATISACARALSLSVHDLRTVPLEHLLPRMHFAERSDNAEPRRRLWERATHPELIAWLDRNPDRARQLAMEEIEELLALQGEGGPLAVHGVAVFVERIERRRKLVRQVGTIAATEYVELLEKFVDLLYEKVQPTRRA